MVLKTAAAALVLAGLTGLATWLMPGGAGGQQALAGVQDRLDEGRSVSYTATTRVDGRPDVKRRVLILGADRARVEGPGEEALIVDLGRGETLRLEPGRKRATLWTGSPKPEAALGLYQTIRRANRDAARDLPDRTIGGRRAIGFVVDREGASLRVWVDAETGLPVLGESSGVEGGRAAETTFTDFAFDRELDGDLFLTTPPAGYAVEERRLPAPASLAERDAALVIAPGVGFGPVRFGDPRAEVIEALGEPDLVEASGSGQGAELLRYDSRGFWIVVDGQGRFAEVACHAHPDRAAPAARTFLGKTEAGVRLGDEAGAIAKAYGQPDARQATERSKAGHELETLTYWERCLSFSLQDGSIVEINAWSAAD